MWVEKTDRLTVKHVIAGSQSPTSAGVPAGPFNDDQLRQIVKTVFDDAESKRGERWDRIKAAVPWGLTFLGLIATVSLTYLKFFAGDESQPAVMDEAPIAREPPIAQEELRQSIDEPTSGERGKLDVIRLLVKTSVTSGDLDSLRKERGLRGLTEDELGMEMGKLAAGTYFFTLAARLDDQSFPLPKAVAITPNLKRISPKQYFEFHKLGDGDLHILLFVDQGTAARVSTLDGITEQVISAYPSPSEKRSVLISLPVGRAGAAKLRLTEQFALDMVIR